MSDSADDLQDSYDRVADKYAWHFADELHKKPFDRKMLDLLIEKVDDIGGGVICDVGCGPGQVAGYLNRRGANACGIDLSVGMVEVARRAHPHIWFERGDMLSLPGDGDFFSGIAAFYSIIHIPRPRIREALVEMKRVLLPRGALLLAFHIGKETIHRDEMWGIDVSLDFNFLETEEIKTYLQQAGFELEEVVERDPYAEDIEYQSRRAYIFARKSSY